MSVKKFTMKSRNGTVWDELYPLTSSDQVITDSSREFVSETEKTTWNGKQNALGYSPVNKAGDTMVGDLILKADPTNPLHPATKQYVDNLLQGITSKTEVMAATTANINLSGTQTIDGVVLAVGDHVLIKNQTVPAENGIYVVASGSWTRDIAYATIQSLSASFVFVQQGTINADKGWVCTVDDTGTLGTTAINWTQFSGAGSVVMVNGTGITITQTGNQFTIAHADTSSQATSTNTGATVIQSIGLDAMGHISSISTKTLTTTDIGAVPTSDVVTSPTANKILKLDANSKLPANITGNADGNAATATKLSAAKTITVSGDVDGTVTTDFSTNPSISLALDSIVAAGSNTKVTYDAKGRVTSATRAKPSEVGITTSATASPPSTPVDGDLWFEITG